MNQTTGTKPSVRSSHPLRRLLPLLLVTLLLASAAVGFWIDSRIQGSEAQLSKRQTQLETNHGLLILQTGQVSLFDLNLLKAGCTAMGIAVRGVEQPADQSEYWVPGLTEAAQGAGMLAPAADGGKRSVQILALGTPATEALSLLPYAGDGLILLEPRRAATGEDDAHWIYALADNWPSGRDLAVLPTSADLPYWQAFFARRTGMSGQLLPTAERFQVSPDGLIQIVPPPQVAGKDARQIRQRTLDICSILADRLAVDRVAHLAMMTAAADAVLRVTRSRTLALTLTAASVIVLLLALLRLQRRRRPGSGG